MNTIERLTNQVRDIMSKDAICINDTAHDFEHVLRVYHNALRLSNAEGVEPLLACCAALLHDIVIYPKSDERSGLSSTHSARLARRILTDYDLTTIEVDIICTAIVEHSYTNHIRASSIYSQILQDADRLDALGAIGIARAFTTGAKSNRVFYSTIDPFCTTRTPDDHVWTLDHFYTKLLHLESLMNTNSAKIEADNRTKFIKIYLKQLDSEIQP